MSSREVIVTRGPKGHQASEYQRILAAVLAQAEKFGTWRMAAKHAECAKTDGSFFVKGHDSRGVTALIQPNGKDSGYIWDIVCPDDYDTEDLYLELQAWNGFKYTQPEEIITVEHLDLAKRFRQKESEWRTLTEHKKVTEDQITRMLEEIGDMDNRLAELTLAISRDVAGAKAWEIFKKALEL